MMYMKVQDRFARPGCTQVVLYDSYLEFTHKKKRHQEDQKKQQYKNTTKKMVGVGTSNYKYECVEA